MIENIDENMGRLMNKLDQWKLSKNMILIFMSDNGSVGGMVRQGSKLGMNKDGKVMEGFNAGMKGAKGSADEGGVRVPFFVRWQGKLSLVLQCKDRLLILIFYQPLRRLQESRNYRRIKWKDAVWYLY